MELFQCLHFGIKTRNLLFAPIFRFFRNVGFSTRMTCVLAIVLEQTWITELNLKLLSLLVKLKDDCQDVDSTFQVSQSSYQHVQQSLQSHFLLRHFWEPD